MECGPWGSGEGPGGDHMGWADQAIVSRGHRQGLREGQVLDLGRECAGGADGMRSVRAGHGCGP